MDWDLTSYFFEFNGPTYKAYKSDLKDGIKALTLQADAILKEYSGNLSDWEALIIDYEQMLTHLSHFDSYLGCLTSAEAANESYLKEEAAHSETVAEVSKLQNKIKTGLGRIPDQVFGQLLQRGRLQDTAFTLTRLREEAKLCMADELESLAADLGVNGISAWSRLYFTTMGNLKFKYQDPDRGECTVPMAQLNSLLSNPSRKRRIAAYEGAVRTFSEHEQTYAAALNAISGTRHTLNKRRGVTHYLGNSLRQSRITETTLNALMTAIEDRVPFGREVFRFRNSCLGIEDPGYVDLRAPIPIGDESGPSWEEGVSLISSAFNAAYPALGTFFDEMIEKRWIDHTPRENKRPGGFCTGSLATRESRIFMTYKDTLNDVMTLAHEAGHAWHSRILKNTRPLAARYPMTIAEAASTFAERILTEGILEDIGYAREIKLVLLDAEIEHMLSFLLDLPVRFKFEKSVYENRKKGTLSPGEYCNLMREAQREIFGDSLAEGREDPWFWASKLHFYIEEVEFYNYPYTFGYLLSTAYISRLRDGADGALNNYERFLSNSGKMSCEDLVKMTLDEDIEDPNFWASLIDQLSRPFGNYKKLLKEFMD